MLTEQSERFRRRVKARALELGMDGIPALAKAIKRTPQTVYRVTKDWEHPGHAGACFAIAMGLELKLVTLNRWWRECGQESKGGES